MIIALCLLAAVSALFAAVLQFQMLQQNSYFISRYYKWVKDSFFESLILLTLCFCAISVCYTFNPLISVILQAAFAAWQGYTAYKTYKGSIKKLVFTSRIIRLFAIEAVLLTILICFALTTRGITQGIALCVLLFFCVFSPALTLVGAAVAKPVEAAFARYYVNDAKRIIKNARNLRVIGVTGSFGKTGTKFILSRILSEKYNVLATPLSYNTPMGVVRTIREKLRPQTQIFVCEMGAKNIGDIKEICDIVNPDMGIISSVGAQHLETFKSVDNVFRTKFELYDACRKNGGKVYANLSSAGIAERLGSRECTTYGLTEGDFAAFDISYSQSGVAFRIVGKGYDFPVSTKLLGKHNVLNITGAAALALELGLGAEDIQYAVSRLEPTEHRLELKSYVCGSLCLDDAYNANPEGCIEALQVLSSFKGMKKVVITPGLVELGDKEYDFNYKLGLAATTIADAIILVGKQRAKPMLDAIATTPYPTDKVFTVSSFKEALEIYTTFADDNTVVLLENDLPDNYLK